MAPRFDSIPAHRCQHYQMDSPSTDSFGASESGLQCQKAVLLERWSPEMLVLLSMDLFGAQGSRIQCQEAEAVDPWVPES